MQIPSLFHDILKWFTKSGHRVKAVNWPNEVNDDNRNKNKPEVHRRVQARRRGVGFRSGRQLLQRGQVPKRTGSAAACSSARSPPAIAHCINRHQGTFRIKLCTALPAKF